MSPLTQRVFAEWLGTAFLLAAVVGSGIMAQKLAGGNEALALHRGAFGRGFGAEIAFEAIEKRRLRMTNRRIPDGGWQ